MAKHKLNGHGVLRSILEEACLHRDCSLSDLTVLSTQIDPYRMDTPSGHREGKWLATYFNKLVTRGRRIHWRGVHYALVAKH